MYAKEFVFLLQVMLAHSVLMFRMNYPTSTQSNGEYFVFKLCSIVLEETDWKYISMVTYDLNELDLSEDFMKNFHNEV